MNLYGQVLPSFLSRSARCSVCNLRSHNGAEVHYFPFRSRSIGFRSMLTNNLPLIHFPTIEHLTAAIAEGRDELEQLCHQAKNTEDPHEEYYLSVHINQLSKDLDSYASILSPLRGMPPELIGEIFMQYHALTAPSECPFMKKWRAGQRGRWILSAVCQSWRAIATSLPALWTEVSIYLDVTRNGIGFTRMYPVSVLRTALESRNACYIQVGLRHGTADRNFGEHSFAETSWAQEPTGFDHLHRRRLP
ncbi:hypothetical protein C8J57DRAFT_407185 [Mycena rebaudengoi]|nr:hypothetical protein C8J57DRAFT_407185 [Mycena rebaudengoi]